ncbi:cytochrome P450 [Crepidotus variabilis]|uniref:Cytochrome P450 n=1 Tax=Crepidotus variabilis TaxID=179855 RepID=A0A9P6ENF8_9AGAR|nr:cytochrome P450 [Crepidotus variabilis]
MDQPGLRYLPTVGSTLPLLSQISCIRFLMDTRKAMEDALSKWPKSLFIVPALCEWVVIATEPALIDDIRKAPESVLSASTALREGLQTDHTVGPHMFDNDYHIAIVRSQLTRSLPRLVPEVHDELIEAFKDYIPLTEDWSTVQAYNIVAKLVSRASNRIFVGVPLCRNHDWIDLSIQYTFDVVQTGQLLRFFPSFLRPLVVKLISQVNKRTKIAFDLLQPLIAERRKEREGKPKEYQGKPEDMLSWIMDEAKGTETDDWHLTSRILMVNFVAIHTSSVTFTHALYHLAASPEYLEPLREEIDNVTSREGWTKEALDQMSRVDSFMKESQRLKPMANYLMNRVVMKDYQFSNGVTVPAGSVVGVMVNHHTSKDIFEEPYKFDGFRFVKMREQAITAGLTEKKFNMVTTGIESLAFGHGRHACPGRFFATAELKLMFAYMVMNYDLRTVEEGVRPKDFYFMQTCIPNMKAEILFKRRQV